MSRKMLLLLTLSAIFVLVLAACAAPPTPTPAPKPTDAPKPTAVPATVAPKPTDAPKPTETKPAPTATTAPTVKPTETKSAASGATLTAAKASAAPKSAADAAWNSATAFKTTLGKSDVTLKALYTSDEVYFLATWTDDAVSMVKTAWKYDGTKWEKQKGDEDRITFVWEMTPIKDFATKGCTVLCHTGGSDPTKWYMAVDSADQKADLWHWKSYRTNPLNFADDGSISVSDTKAAPPTGRLNDAGGGGDSRNETADKTNPALMQDPAKTPSAKGFLVKGETVEIKDFSSFKAGDVLPYRILSKPDGSRGDIKANGAWASGAWTLMLNRKLNTGNADDVQFDPGKTYLFSVAVYNDAGDMNKSSYAGTITLTFAK
ncbi:hypothetical protein ANRL3_01233 [Anaerolineae bacterium]|nr:hypothetical protein ANRL3_01233 [Anaerolineae bacterium]